MASVWTQIEADKAFARATRAGRRVAIACRIHGRGCGCEPLAVFEPLAGGAPARRDAVALADIRGTLEPNRLAQFDCAFNPRRSTRARWQRVWSATRRGDALPPVRLVRAGDGYAIRDGHHRVSVAHALGAVTIDAVVEG